MSAEEAYQPTIESFSLASTNPAFLLHAIDSLPAELKIIDFGLKTAVHHRADYPSSSSYAEACLAAGVLPFASLRFDWENSLGKFVPARDYYLPDDLEPHLKHRIQRGMDVEATPNVIQYSYFPLILDGQSPLEGRAFYRHYLQPAIAQNAGRHIYQADILLTAPSWQNGLPNATLLLERTDGDQQYRASLLHCHYPDRAVLGQRWLAQLGDI